MYESKMKSEETDHLFEAILSLKDKEECYRFFDDLCTYSEILAMTQRFQVAEELYGALDDMTVVTVRVEERA